MSTGQLLRSTAQRMRPDATRPHNTCRTAAVMCVGSVLCELDQRCTIRCGNVDGAGCVGLAVSD